MSDLTVHVRYVRGRYVGTTEGDATKLEAVRQSIGLCAEYRPTRRDLPHLREIAAVHGFRVIVSRAARP